MPARILIAEDDLLTSKAIEHRLKLEGYEVFTAFNGKIASKILQNQEIDMLLVDIHMPYVGGLELIKFVRNNLKKSFPIAVVSRIGIEETVFQAFKMGADDYITKPFNPKELSESVKKLLNK